MFPYKTWLLLKVIFICISTQAQCFTVKCAFPRNKHKHLQPIRIHLLKKAQSFKVTGN